MNGSKPPPCLTWLSLSSSLPLPLMVQVAVGRDMDAVFMAMEFMEHDLKGLLDEMQRPFSQAEAKTLMMQLLEGTQYMHDHWVLHR
jgi:cell division cycle 2-like protein